MFGHLNKSIIGYEHIADDGLIFLLEEFILKRLYDPHGASQGYYIAVNVPHAMKEIFYLP